MTSNPSVIEGIHELHLETRDLERSVAFYQSLGLTLGVKHARGAFFWVTQPGEQLLGIWLVKEDQVPGKRHLAFKTSLEQLLQASHWLRERGIAPIGAFGKEPDEPIVHPWMPAATVYFHDPDGNELKLQAMLEEAPIQMPGVLYYSEWRKLCEERG